MFNKCPSSTNIYELLPEKNNREEFGQKNERRANGPEISALLQSAEIVLNGQSCYFSKLHVNSDLKFP